MDLLCKDAVDTVDGGGDVEGTEIGMEETGGELLYNSSGEEEGLNIEL